jgi:two-component system, cell cycle sensor histidine kinase and response regulator CckA
MEHPLRVLMVEDSEDDALLLSRELRRGGYAVQFSRVDTAAAFTQALTTAEWDLVIADYNMPQFSGLAALRVLQEQGKDIPFLVVSGFIDENVAVAAMKSGAHDYLMKDNLKRLAPAVERELREAKVRRERRQAAEALRAGEARLRQANDSLLYLARSPSVQEGDLEQAFAEISQIAGLSLGVSLTSIWLFNAERTLMICQKAYEMAGNLYSEGLTLEINRYPRFFTALQDHRFISTAESQLDPRIKEFNDDYLIPNHIVSSLDAAVRLRGEVVGVVCLDQRDVPRRWMPEEEIFAGSVADLVSLALGANERRLAAEALRNSEQRYRDLFENANDMIYTMDLAGHFTSINRRGEEMTGYSRAELLGRTGDLLMLQGERALSRSQLNRKMALESDHTVYEITLVTKSGQQLPVEVNSRLVFENGQPVAIQGIARDISQRKQLEEELRQSQKMEAIGRLAGAVAHDFNNMLTAILGYSQLLLLRMEPQSPWRKEVSEIEKAGRSAAALTSQLLAFSRKQGFKPQQINLNQVVSSIEHMLGRLIGDDIELAVALEAGLGTIKADPNQIEQVLMNLAVNSRDAMPQGGALRIETANTYIDANYALHHRDVLPGPYVVLTVCDNGVGMDHETQLRIFEPFFTTKDEGKGTGLGLATVYGIVKQCQGLIEVQSQPGVGTTFRIYFPHIHETTALSEGTSTYTAAQGDETVLLAEDNDAVRALARQMLEMNGYKVLEARNPTEALMLCRSYEGAIAAILTDVSMPQMNGPELARQVLLARPNLGVIYMSGNSDTQLLPAAVNGEQLFVVTKPFTPETLTQALRLALDQITVSTPVHPQYDE